MILPVAVTTMVRRAMLQARDSEIFLLIFFLALPRPVLLYDRNKDVRQRTIFVAISSDDWGRWAGSLPVFASEEAFLEVHADYMEKSQGVPYARNPLVSMAETAEDVENLRLMLVDLNRGVSLRQRVVLSPYVVVGGPDYAAMRSTGCPEGPKCSYRELLYPQSAGGLAEPPYNRGDLRSSYSRMFHERLWYPQYHGRSHFDHGAWVHYLRSGDEMARFFFRRNMTYCDIDGGHSLNGEYLSDQAAHQRSQHDLAVWLRRGLAAFREWWGYTASVTCIPSHHYSGSTLDVLAEEGVTALEAALLNDRETNAEVREIPRFDIDLEPTLAISASLSEMAQEQEVQLRNIDELLQWTDFLSLQWHSSNCFPFTKIKSESPTASLLVKQHLGHVVRHIRRTYPNAIFVTTAELSQIMADGLSVIPWGRAALQLRNYNEEPRQWMVPPLPDPSWEGGGNGNGSKGDVTGGGVRGVLRSECDAEWGEIGAAVDEGQVVTLKAMCEYELRGDAKLDGDEELRAGGACGGEKSQGGGLRWRISLERGDEESGEEEGGVSSLRTEDVLRARWGAREGETWEGLVYYLRTHANQSEMHRLGGMLRSGQFAEVADACRELKDAAEAAHRQEHAAICDRCRLCSTCKPLPRSGGLPLPALPFLRVPIKGDEYSANLWRERTCRRPRHNASVEGAAGEGEDGVHLGDDAVSISISVLEGHVEARVSGYDFDKKGGYVIMAQGVNQLTAWKGTYQSLFLHPSSPDSVILVCLMLPSGRPMGICQVDMFYSSDARAPYIVDGAAATRHSAPPWRPGQSITSFPVPPAAPAVRVPAGRRVAFVLTSCVAMDGRLSLLEETILSFLSSNTYPIERYVLIDDSGNAAVHARLLSLFGDVFDVLANVRSRTGQMFSIDAAYSLAIDGGEGGGLGSVNYIFHCQDDWLFHTKGDFIQESMTLLEELPNAMLVWCRDHSDHGLPLSHIDLSPSGVPYHLVVPTQKWKGFSFNPGLRRVRDYEIMRPMQRFWVEDNVQAYMRWMGMFGVSLSQGWVRHTGDDYSTKPSYHWANSEMAKAAEMHASREMPS